MGVDQSWADGADPLTLAAMDRVAMTCLKIELSSCVKVKIRTAPCENIRCDVTRLSWWISSDVWWRRGHSLPWCSLHAVCASDRGIGRSIIFDAVWLLLWILLPPESGDEMEYKWPFSGLVICGCVFFFCLFFFPCDLTLALWNASYRDRTPGSSLYVGSGPGQVSRLQHPLVLWQAGQRLRPVLVRRLWRQQEPLWHRRGVQEDVCGTKNHKYAFMIRPSHTLVLLVPCLLSCFCFFFLWFPWPKYFKNIDMPICFSSAGVWVNASVMHLL